MVKLRSQDGDSKEKEIVTEDPEEQRIAQLEEFQAETNRKLDAMMKMLSRLPCLQESDDRSALDRDTSPSMKAWRSGSSHSERSGDDRWFSEEDRRFRDYLMLRNDDDDETWTWTEHYSVMDDETDSLEEESMPQFQVPVSDLEHGLRIHNASSIVCEDSQYVVGCDELSDHQKSILQVSYVKEVEELPPKSTSGNGEHVAHQLFAEMSQHEETLGLKKKQKGLKSWRFKFKHRVAPRDSKSGSKWSGYGNQWKGILGPRPVTEKVVLHTNKEKLEGNTNKPLTVTEQTEVQEEKVMPQISVNAIEGIPSYRTMRVKGTYGKRPLLILIDFGSTHNFLDVKVAEKLGYNTLPMGMAKASVAGGRQLEVRGQVDQFPWQFQTTEFQADFMIIPLGGYDLVLGIQWLETLGPITWDSKKLEMRFMLGKHKIHLTGLQQGSVREVKALKLAKIKDIEAETRKTAGSLEGNEENAEIIHAETKRMECSLEVDQENAEIISEIDALLQIADYKGFHKQKVKDKVPWFGDFMDELEEWSHLTRKTIQGYLGHFLLVATAYWTTHVQFGSESNHVWHRWKARYSQNFDNRVWDPGG